MISRELRDALKGIGILIALYLVLSMPLGSEKIFNGLGSTGERLIKALQGRP